jgi:hypothetical protein
MKASVISAPSPNGVLPNTAGAAQGVSSPCQSFTSKATNADHGVGSTDHFSALKIWMFENKFVSLPSHLKTIEPMARPIREKSGTGV